MYQYIMLYYLIYSFRNIDFKIKNTDKKCIIIILCAINFYEQFT